MFASPELQRALQAMQGQPSVALPAVAALTDVPSPQGRSGVLTRKRHVGDDRRAEVTSEEQELLERVELLERAVTVKDEQLRDMQAILARQRQELDDARAETAHERSRFAELQAAGAAYGAAFRVAAQTTLDHLAALYAMEPTSKPQATALFKSLFQDALPTRPAEVPLKAASLVQWAAQSVPHIRNVLAATEQRAQAAARVRDTVQQVIAEMDRARVRVSADALLRVVQAMHADVDVMHSALLAAVEQVLAQMDRVVQLLHALSAAALDPEVLVLTVTVDAEAERISRRVVWTALSTYLDMLAVQAQPVLALAEQAALRRAVDKYLSPRLAAK